MVIKDNPGKCLPAGSRPIWPRMQRIRNYRTGGSGPSRHREAFEVFRRIRDSGQGHCEPAERWSELGSGLHFKP